MIPASSGARGALLVAAAVLIGGCVEWLEMPAPEDERAEGPEVVEHVQHPGRLPTARPRAGAAGPIVPTTPGLRVPDGYWSRVRLDTADLWLPWTWASAQVVGEGTSRRLFLRILATAGGITPGDRTLRAVIPLSVPEGTRVESLVDLDLGPEALGAATISLRTDARNLWQVVPTRLTVEAVRPWVIAGTLEGVARRGSQGQRERRFEAGFLALRAPEPGG